jgi:putative Mg2+ transporter-C (MgtC) family protein
MHCLLAATGAIYPHVPDSWELSGRLVLAAVLGAVVGIEREVNDHPSGLRTHITVALGAALFGITSAYAWHNFVAMRNDNNYGIDPTRIAAQIVSGVGFLGAGAIIKQGNTVRGLTSAAGLWVSAAIGLATALGMYVAAIVTTLTLTVLLVMLKRPRSWLRARLRTVRENIVVSISIDDDPSDAISALGAMAGTVIRSLVVKREQEEGVTLIEAEVEVAGGRLEQRLAKVEALPEVLSVEIG